MEYNVVDKSRMRWILNAQVLELSVGSLPPMYLESRVGLDAINEFHFQWSASHPNQRDRCS
jgi:hypothetical protein